MGGGDGMRSDHGKGCRDEDRGKGSRHRGRSGRGRGGLDAAIDFKVLAYMD